MIKQKAVSDYFTCLGFNSKIIKKSIETDKESKILFIEGKKKIPKCSKIRHRIELLKLSESVYAIFVVKLINRLSIIIEIKTKAVKDFWLNCFDPIMDELDKLLWTEEKPLVTLCDCRNVGFGFCFCRS
jgi:hypothetical protein